MTSPAPAVTVGGLLKTRPEAFGLDLERFAGSGGLDRRVTNPDSTACCSTLLRPHITIDAETWRRRGILLKNKNFLHLCVPASLRRALFRAAGVDDIDESEIDDAPETGDEP